MRKVSKDWKNLCVLIERKNIYSWLMIRYILVDAVLISIDKSVDEDLLEPFILFIDDDNGL